jgi:hypothetical protein
MPTMQDSHVILDQNGAEELTPPGQAIFVRSMETLTEMTPYLPDDERAQRLNALRSEEIELTELKKDAAGSEELDPGGQRADRARSVCSSEG